MRITWVIGVVMAILTPSFGVTGCSSSRDQISYWALQILIDVPELFLVITLPLIVLLRGSASVGQSTLTCFFALLLLIAILMLVHF